MYLVFRWLKRCLDWLLSFLDRKEIDLFKDNKHIEDYLDYYINLKEAPLFAVLIKGQWGSGKSWFIDNYLQKTKASDSQQIVKISLYGLNSIDEINTELFRMIHPGLNTIKSGLLGKLITSASKSKIMGVQVDLSDFLPSGTYKFKDDKEYILIFDDFERSHIDRNVLMGYLNQFVEIHSQKVILIADESKITNPENESNSFKYNEVKEKLIGKTFTVKPNMNNALLSFIKEKDDFFQEQYELIKSTYQKANHKNLRHLKQAIEDFQRFLNGLDKQVQSEKKLVNQLFEIFLIFTIEIKAGKLNSKDVSRIQSDYSYWYKKAIDNDSEAEESNIDKLTKKYPHIQFHSPTYYLFSKGTWFEILDQNNFDFEKINNELLELLNSSNIPDWRKLIEFWSLTDEQYSKLIEEIDKNILARKYLNMGEIKHIFGMLLYFSEQNIYPKSTSTILKDAKEYIDDIASQGYLDVEAIKPTSFDGTPDSCCGYRFLSYDTEHFKKLKAYITSKFSELSIPIQKEKAKQLVESINNDSTAEMFEEKSFDFDGLPFLQYIDVANFVEAILNKPTYSTRKLNQYLVDRYKHISVRESHHLCDEQDFVNDCLVIFTSEKDNNRTLSKMTCEHFIKLFSDAKTSLESIQNQVVLTDESQ